MSTSTGSKNRFFPYTLDQHGNPILKKVKQAEEMSSFAAKKSASKVKITLRQTGALSKEKKDQKEPLNLPSEATFHEKPVTSLAKAKERSCLKKKLISLLISLQKTPFDWTLPDSPSFEIFTEEGLREKDFSKEVAEDHYEEIFSVKETSEEELT